MGINHITSNLYFFVENIFLYLAPAFLKIIAVSFLCIISSYPVEAETVSNTRYYHVSDDRIVIYYDLAGQEASQILVEASFDGVSSSPVELPALSGDVGENINPGGHKRIVWKLDNPLAKLPDEFNVQVISGTQLPISKILNYGDKTIAACPVDESIHLDGLLNESCWDIADIATGFIQQEPVEGAPATEKTEVKVLYDKDNLYIGVMCYDSEPEKIIHNELVVDAMLWGDDNFQVIFDTFNDNRTGYFFNINPNGARYDALSSGSGPRMNRDWNALWDASAKILDDGWSAEIVIPFKTLSFQRAELQNWGINFSRDIVRKNEFAFWTAWGRDDGITQLTKAGTLSNLKNLKRGSKIEFKPFVLTGIENDEGTYDENIKGGLDVKYPLSSDLTLNLTTFTDFAQIEADQTRINLTRFDLRYPEKRDFFLAGAEMFEFGDRFNSPFYSRNIGLTPDREQVPILGGAKVTGKAGKYRLGILNMQTERKNGYPSTNYSVVRVKRDILEQSTIGMIATNIYSESEHKDTSFGADFNYSTDKFLKNKNLSISSSIAGNKKSNDDSVEHTGRFSVFMPNDLVFLYLIHSYVSEDYDPGLGFVRRNGVKTYDARINISPRPGIPFIRQLDFSLIDLNLYTDLNGKILTRDVSFSPFGLTTSTEDRFSFDIVHSYEYLDEDFNIHDDVVIPKGTYEWFNYSAMLRSNSSRWLSLDLETEWGEFFNGNRSSYETGVEIKVNKHLTFSTDVIYNNLTIDNRSFDTSEYSFRLNTNVSPKLNVRTYVQWNNEDKIANLNFRIRFIPKIGSDIYFVYNHLWDGNDRYKTSYNTAIAKIAYMISI